MFHQFFASVMMAFSLLPQTVMPAETAIDVVTRAEAATALLLARDPNVAVIKNTGQFPDVKKSDWFSPYMLAAERFGIVKASAITHELRPNAPVNRAEFLKMLALTFAVPTGYTHTFTDISKEAWYSEYAGIVRSFKLPLADNATTFGPSNPVTHEQALQSIQTFVRLYNPSAKTILDEQQIAIDQSQNHLMLYNVISTRKTKVVFITGKDIKPTAPVTPPPSLPELRTQIMTLVNTERLKAGLKPLIYHTLLEQSAQRYAEEMSANGFFGHVSPDGQTLKDRVEATGYYTRSYSDDCRCIKGFSLGENLGRGQKTADEVMKDWMQSQTHRAAILSPDYTEMGVGVSSGIWVEHFGGTLLPGQKMMGKEGV